MKKRITILATLSILSLLSVLSFKALYLNKSAQAQITTNAKCTWNAVDQATSYECVVTEVGGVEKARNPNVTPSPANAPTIQDCNFTAEPGEEYRCQVTPKYVEAGVCDVSGPIGQTTNTCQACQAQQPNATQHQDDPPSLSWERIANIDHYGAGFFYTNDNTCPADTHSPPRIYFAGSANIPPETTSVQVTQDQWNSVPGGTTVCWDVASTCKADADPHNAADWSNKATGSFVKPTPAPGSLTVRVQYSKDNPAICEIGGGNARDFTDWVTVTATKCVDQSCSQTTDETFSNRGNTGTIPLENITPGFYKLSESGVEGEYVGQWSGCADKIWEVKSGQTTQAVMLLRPWGNWQCTVREDCDSSGPGESGDGCKQNNEDCAHPLGNNFLCCKTVSSGPQRCPYPCVGDADDTQTNNYNNFCRAENATWGSCQGNTICCCRERDKTYDPPPPDTVPYCDTGEVPPTPTLTPTLPPAAPTATPTLGCQFSGYSSCQGVCEEEGGTCVGSQNCWNCVVPTATPIQAPTIFSIDIWGFVYRETAVPGFEDVVEGAEVAAAAGTSTLASATTDVSGFYRFDDLPIKDTNNDGVERLTLSAAKIVDGVLYADTLILQVRANQTYSEDFHLERETPLAPGTGTISGIVKTFKPDIFINLTLFYCKFIFGTGTTDCKEKYLGGSGGRGDEIRYEFTGETGQTYAIKAVANPDIEARSRGYESGYTSEEKYAAPPATNVDLTITIPAAPPQVIQQADVDGNGTIGAGDYNIVAQGYGQSGVDLSCDVNKDGVCNALDLSFVLSNFDRLIK